MISDGSCGGFVQCECFVSEIRLGFKLLGLNVSSILLCLVTHYSLIIHYERDKKKVININACFDYSVTIQK